MRLQDEFYAEKIKRYLKWNPGNVLTRMHRKRTNFIYSGWYVLYISQLTLNHWIISTIIMGLMHGDLIETIFKD